MGLATGSQLLNNGARARTARLLKQWIADGSLQPGHPLPPERELAARLQVNRATLRSALGQLGEEGLLSSSGGRSRRVAAPSREPVRLLQHAVVILTRNPGGAGREHRDSGWLDSLDQGVMDAVRSAGLHFLAFHPSRVGNDEREHLLCERPYGVILTELVHDWPEILELLPELARAGVPIVAYGDEPEFAQLDRVTSGHDAGAFELTSWLLGQGLRRIVQVWPEQPSSYWLRGRREGYERAMRNAGVAPLAPVWVPHLKQEESGSPGSAERFEARKRHLAGHLVEHLSGPERVEALMMASDGEIFPASAACRLFGLEPGRDVLLTGYDNYWSDSGERELEPARPAATMDKHNCDMGRAMMDLLQSRTAGHLAPEAQLLVVPPTLITFSDAKA